MRCSMHCSRWWDWRTRTTGWSRACRWKSTSNSGPLDKKQRRIPLHGMRRPACHRSFLASCLLAALISVHCFTGMHHAERAATVGPDQNESVFAGRHAAEFALGVSSTGYLVTIHLNDYVTTGKTRVVCRAPRLYISNHCTLHVVGKLQFFTNVRSNVQEPDAPARFAVS